MMLARYSARQVGLSALPDKNANPRCQTIRSILSAKLPPLESFGNQTSINNGNSSISKSPLKDSKGNAKKMGQAMSKPNMAIIKSSPKIMRTRPFNKERFDKIDISEQLPKELNDEYKRIFNEKYEICVTCINPQPKQQNNDVCMSVNDFCQIKTIALTEIYQSIQNIEIYSQITNYYLDKVLMLIEANIYRCLPTDSKILMNLEEPVSIVDPNFVHLDIVYQMYLYFVNHINWAPLVPHYFHKRFILAANSLDSRERDVIVQVLVHFYVNYEDRRTEFVSDVFNSIFDYINGLSSPISVTPLLLFLCRIFSASLPKVPIEWQQQCILKVIPLIKSNHFQWFYKTFKRLIYIIFQSNPSSPSILLRYIIYHWPILSQSKQPLIIGLLFDIIDHMNENELYQKLTPIFRIIAECSRSSSSKVAEEAFKIWQNKKILGLVEKKSSQIFELVRDPVIEAMKSHWSASTKDAALTVIDMMNKIDQNAFEMAAVAHHQRSMTNNKVHMKWVMIAQTAAQRDRFLPIGDIMRTIDTTISPQKKSTSDLLQIMQCPKNSNRIRRHSQMPKV